MQLYCWVSWDERYVIWQCVKTAPQVRSIVRLFGSAPTQEQFTYISWQFHQMTRDLPMKYNVFSVSLRTQIIFLCCILIMWTIYWVVKMTFLKIRCIWVTTEMFFDAYWQCTRNALQVRFHACRPLNCYLLIAFSECINNWTTPCWLISCIII